MTLGLLIRETMQGWIEIDGKRSDLELRLEAFTHRWWSLTAARPFEGTVSIGFEPPLAASGLLRIYPRGPHYQVRFYHPHQGWLTLEGKKHYRLSQLRHSLTTCPLQVFRQHKLIGSAELAYRQPLWRFPLESLRLAWRRTAEEARP